MVTVKKLARNVRPTRDEVLDLLEQGIETPARLANRFGRTPDSARRWLHDYELDEPDKVKAALDLRAQQKANLPQILPQVDQADTIVSAQIGVIDRQSVGPNFLSQDDELSALDRLSERQLRAVHRLISTDENDTQTVSNQDLAEYCSVSIHTIMEWKRDETFQEAIRELAVPSFKTEALLLVTKRLSQLLKTGKDRPEDRKLMAEISGLVNGQTTNVHVSMSNSGFFANRFK